MCYTWRYAGMRYIDYSMVAARTMRKALKAEFQQKASQRNKSSIKINYWENGKPCKDCIPAHERLAVYEHQK